MFRGTPCITPIPFGPRSLSLLQRRRMTSLANLLKFGWAFSSKTLPKFFPSIPVPLPAPSMPSQGINMSSSHRGWWGENSRGILGNLNFLFENNSTDWVLFCLFKPKSVKLNIERIPNWKFFWGGGILA